MDSYLAHIRKGEGGIPAALQTVSAHCRKAAEYAAQVLAPVSLSAGGYLAGLIHDAGKFTVRFQEYLQNGSGARGSVNHTFAGVRLLLSRYHEAAGSYADVASELLAFACGSHHGLFDCIDEQGQSGFRRRLTQEDIGYEQAKENFFNLCAAPEELDSRFQAAREELAAVLEKIGSMTGEEASDDRYDEETAFYCGLLARLLLSAVIEGDRRDTAEFMYALPFPLRRDKKALIELWRAALGRVEEKLERLPQSTPVDRARGEISRQCRLAAGQPGGVFRLHVPTGGGKTLASLRYALAHALNYGKQRILFVSPLLSILEQNAAVIRDYIREDGVILEHHSNLVREENPEQAQECGLLCENWDVPVIITTLVQLLNTLFSGKTTAIRRFHTLCGSVIILDEVQTVPGKMLSLFSLAVNFLAEVCGATVVLCSATQPCLEQIEHPLHTPIAHLVPPSSKVREVFRRTDIQDIGEKSLKETACFARQQLEKLDSLLIVCNKREEAKALFCWLEGADAERFFLSADMCAAHRRKTLKRLRACLEEGKRAVCISTQVIEAGVDISFCGVIRLAAGMDSVIQAAGRCNRSGEAGPGNLAPVYLVRCQNESLGRLPDIERGKAATLELLSEFVRQPERYGHALDSDEAVRCYYRALYRRMPRGYHDYPVSERPSLFSLLARNEQYEESPQENFYFRQAFRLAGSLFEVFEQSTADVIVPYGEGAELIRELLGAGAERDPAYLKELLGQARPYSVSLYSYQLQQLERENGLLQLPGGAIALSGHYNEQTGFSMAESSLDFLTL